MPVRANNEAAPLASTAPGVVSSIPEKKELQKHFTPLRRVVEVKAEVSLHWIFISLSWDEKGTWKHADFYIFFS